MSSSSIKRVMIVSAIVALAGCSVAQEARVQADARAAAPLIQSLCSSALTAVNAAGLVPGVGAIEPYVNAGCLTAAGIDKLAADPSSAEWLNNLTAQVQGLAAGAQVQMAPPQVTPPR